VGKKNKKANIINLFKSFEVASTLGFSIAIPISLGTILGAFFDAQTGLKPLFTISLLLLGLAVSLYSGFKVIKKALK
jgi:F0F1-type ATP synthase assembly protein I